ncbi:MAG: hypothetical protein RL497_509 [Pseudomonadota bacterium]
MLINLQLFLAAIIRKIIVAMQNIFYFRVLSLNPGAMNRAPIVRGCARGYGSICKSVTSSCVPAAQQPGVTLNWVGKPRSGSYSAWKFVSAGLWDMV